MPVPRFSCGILFDGFKDFMRTLTVLVEIWYLLPILIKFPRGIIVPLFERKISFWFETIPFIYGKYILILTQEFQERKKN